MTLYDTIAELVLPYGVDVLRAVVWPLVAVYAIWAFRPAITEAL